MKSRDDGNVPLRCVGLTVGFGTRIVQSNLTFSVRRGSIFALMGGSGCGKSTVMRAMFGLLRPLDGAVQVDGENFWAGDADQRAKTSRRFGILFQSAALWSLVDGR